MADYVDQIVQVAITAAASAPSRKSFGIPLGLAYHTHNTDKSRQYSDLAGMVTDGFSTDEPAYKIASRFVQQNPRPPKFRIGRIGCGSGNVAVAQTFTFIVTDNTNGNSVGFDIVSPAGVTTLGHVTPASQTTAQVATAIAALIDAPAGIAAVAAGSTITVTIAAAGAIWFPTGLMGGTYLDTTVNANLDGDLDAILLDNKEWYGVTSAIQSATNLADVASWCESNEKLNCSSTADTANLTATTGIMATLKTAGYKRSYMQYGAKMIEYGAAGLMAGRFTADPGSDTWAYKAITGCSPDDQLSPTQLAAITTNNGNFYITIGGLPGTVDGRSSQGQFMDLQRGIDALQNDIQVRVWGLLQRSPKVPYTTKGIAAVGSQVSAALQAFVRTGFISDDSGREFVVTLPSIADISTADKQDRILNKITFDAYVQGAIHIIKIAGTLNF